MLIDGCKLGDVTEIQGSIAIIGAGAAGITLAMQLATHFNDVLRLERGGLKFDRDTQHLNDGNRCTGLTECLL